MNQSLLNKILLTILIIETILVSGVFGYRLGESKEVPQPIYYITLQVDPSMIEYEEENNPESDEQTSDQSTVIDNKNEMVLPKPAFTDEEAIYIAKTVWGEARGLSKTEQAAVIWTILNRVDDGRFGNNIIGVITAPNQFAGYKSNHPVDEDIIDLVADVRTRYALEKAGVKNVGRVLPKDYLYFRGDGSHNYFTKSWNSSNVWDWSLKSPYVITDDLPSEFIQRTPFGTYDI